MYMHINTTTLALLTYLPSYLPSYQLTYLTLEQEPTNTTSILKDAKGPATLTGGLEHIRQIEEIWLNHKRH
jgi:hypothetical protein